MTTAATESATNVLIFIHGVVEDNVPSTHLQQYQAMLAALRALQPSLVTEIPDNQMIFIEWGHAQLPPPAAKNLTPDMNLTDAENTILAATSYDKIRKQPSPDDSFLKPGWNLFEDAAKALVRDLTKRIKDEVATLGLTDTFYYTSPDGEKAVRGHVYSDVLTQLKPFKGSSKVKLHVIGHSQGATISFDFLFGLLAPDSAYDGTAGPGFVADEQGSKAMQQEYLDWRKQAKEGRLELGSYSSFGSQLSLMMMRKQSLVDKMAKRELLDPTVIGVPRSGGPKWKHFYDTSDVLGYPVRRLFDTSGTLLEYEVNSSWNPVRFSTHCIGSMKRFSLKLPR